MGLLGNEVGETSVDVAGGNAVDTGEVAPLVGERAGHVDAAGLRDVVGGLLLGVVGDVTGHGSSDDEGAGAALLEVGADGLGAVRGPVEVDVDDVVPVLLGAVEDAGVGGSARVRDEGVDLTEVLNHFGHQLLAALVVADVALVGLGLDAVGLGQLLHVLVRALLPRRVRDGHVGAELGRAPRRLDPHASGPGGARHDHHLALEAEEVEEAIGGGDSDRHDGYVEGGLSRVLIYSNMRGINWSDKRCWLGC